MAAEAHSSTGYSYALSYALWSTNTANKQMYLWPPITQLQELKTHQKFCSYRLPETIYFYHPSRITGFKR